MKCGSGTAPEAGSWRDQSLRCIRTLRDVLTACSGVLRHRQKPKRLRLCETLSLGERRFVAVVQFEGRRFLLGGTASSVVLLSTLPAAGEESLTSIPEAGEAA
jgi:hypothetical protein